MTNPSLVQKRGGLFFVLFCLAFLLFMLFLNQLFVNLPSKSKLHFPSINYKNNSFQAGIGHAYCKKKTKIMFSKNSKTGGTTLGAIILQIATHYHKYEILTPMNFGFYVKGDHSNIGYDLTHFRLNVSKFKKLFPKRESLWLSSVRNVHDQVNSSIRYLKLQK